MAAWAGPTAAAGAAPAIFHTPRIASLANTINASWASGNWSGYAKTGAYHSATARWTVPTAARTARPTYSSSWVGIDGFNNSNLIQTGTEQDYFNGSAHYAAWWEILPAAETVIPSITVHPGDVFTASVSQNSGTSWTIRITDTTTGATFSTTRTYTGPGTSVEWIQEAPTVGGAIARLAHYGQATFDPGTANGANPALAATDGGVMIQNNRQVSTPSNPDTDTDGFNAAYGATTPSPPGS
ncbi:MAG TPA: G1 family glutamic endopeptidase [Actinomycetota bacterium]